jgi:peptide/nickel transport system substrate-binding protein
MNIRFFSETSFVPLKQNEAKGNYKIVPYYAERGSENSAIHFNLTTKDPVLRQIFNDVRFRQAASLAIDRAEANKVSWLGLGRPRQASYPSVSPHYMPEWEKHFAQYDPKEANRLLDEMGLTKKDSAGFRLRPDGQTLELVWETSGPPVRPWQELVKEYLGKIGIKIIIQPRENYAARVNSPELQMGMWMFGGDLPRMREDLIPVGSRGGWGTEWKRWFDTGGKEGEKPPEDLIKVNDLINQSYATADQKETIKLAQDAGRIHMKNLWIIGVVGEAPRAGVIKNNFKNLPEDLPYGGYLPEPAIWAAQFFMTK